MRNKVEYRMASKQNYHKFCSENPGLKISYLDWANIIYTFNYSFRDQILETGDILRFPWGLGDLTISKKKRRAKIIDPQGIERINLPVDWAKTKKYGKKIYHMNFHTNGFTFKWKWFPNTSKFKNGRLWVFKPSRVSSRLITHYIKRGNSNKYREWHLVNR